MESSPALRLFCVAAVALTGCFDFTAPVRHGIGGKCGDVNDWCDAPLTCDAGKCQRECVTRKESCEGELCSATLPCPDGLACLNGSCTAPLENGGACAAGEECRSGFCAAAIFGRTLGGESGESPSAGPGPAFLLAIAYVLKVLH